jgi:HEAT repeat protein
VALEAIEALGTVGTDASVPILVTMARRKRFLGGRKLRALKQRSVDALVRVKTETSAAALKDAAEQGDGYLRKIARAKL